jgi:hypothetical protein
VTTSLPNSEVEYVVDTAIGLLPIEVKSGNVAQPKSLGVFQEKYKSQTAVILSSRNEGHRGSRILAPMYNPGVVE